MNKGMIKISIVAATLLCMGTSVMAGGDIAAVEPVKEKSEVKRTLKGNMQIVYNILPGNVDNIGDMFSEGIFYGRLRSNTFQWDWGDEDYQTGGNRKDNRNMGVGGSLIYKSAVLNGVSATFGYYGSLNPGFWRMPKDEVGYAKAGKDTFSRNKVKNGGDYDGEYGMSVLGQAYLEYNNGTVDAKAGRQLFESVFTASNDTKMVPNTFDGVSLAAKVAPKTTARVAWFGDQKLRDHEDAHDVITFKDSSGNSWGNNDDAAVHKGLNYDAFLAAGEDPTNDLYIADVKTKYIENLDFTLSGLSVPGVINDIAVEGFYRFNLDNGWAVRPGVRYIYQMDDGGGDIAGYTNLTGKAATGYVASVANSLDSSLIAVRADIEMPDKKGFFRFGYSKIDDKADIVAPWRGFPTGGFTRAMAQYNWYANTETFLMRAAYKFNDYFNTSLRYAIQDFDDAKVNVQADSTVWHLDNISKLARNLEMKVRVGIVSADPGSTGKPDTSYNEYRLEFNYLF